MDLWVLPIQIPQLLKAGMREEVVLFWQLERLRSSCPWVPVKETKNGYHGIFCQRGIDAHLRTVSESQGLSDSLILLRTVMANEPHPCAKLPALTPNCCSGSRSEPKSAPGFGSLEITLPSGVLYPHHRVPEMSLSSHTAALRQQSEVLQSLGAGSQREILQEMRQQLSLMQGGRAAHAGCNPLL